MFLALSFAPLALVLLPQATRIGTPRLFATRVSVSTTGAQGNDDSGTLSISADGRYVVFESFASTLVPGITNASPSVYLHDLVTGVTERISVDSSGNEANANSHEPVVSGDGRFVAFQSYASNLVAGDTNGMPDIFVRDRTSGTTERVSVDSLGNQGNHGSYHPALSADGRFVSFESDASNLVPGDANLYYDVFVHDRVTESTALVSVDSAENQANMGSTFSALSADGRYIAFQSNATNLAPGSDGNFTFDVFVRDRVNGTTEVVSANASGQYLRGQNPAISADGRYVAYTDGAIRLRDRQTGLLEYVTVDPHGNPADAPCYSPSLSADGRFLAFQSSASNLLPGDTNGMSDVFLLDRLEGSLVRHTHDFVGGPSNGDSGYARLSADGRWLAFASSARDIVVGDTNAVTDVFVAPRGVRR